jgi:hypothetical protein
LQKWIVCPKVWKLPTVLAVLYDSTWIAGVDYDEDSDEDSDYEEARW